MALKGFDSSQASWLMLQHKHGESRAPLVGGNLSIDCNEAVISSPYKCLGQLNLITTMCKAFIQYAWASWLVCFFCCSYKAALTFPLFTAHTSCSAARGLLVAHRGFCKRCERQSLFVTCLISLCRRAIFLGKKGIILEGSRTGMGHSPQPVVTISPVQFRMVVFNTPMLWDSLGGRRLFLRRQMRMTWRQWDFIFKVGTVCKQLASSQISFGNYLLQFALHRKKIRILFLFGSGQTFPFHHAHIQTKMNTRTHLPTWVSLSLQTYLRVRLC